MKCKASVDESVATQKLAGMWRSTDHFVHDEIYIIWTQEDPSRLTSAESIIKAGHIKIQLAWIFLEMTVDDIYFETAERQ